MSDLSAEDLLARYVQEHVSTGARLDLAELCHGQEPLLPAVRALVERYEDLQRWLRPVDAEPPPAESARPELPSFPGFRTLERWAAAAPARSTSSRT